MHVVGCGEVDLKPAAEAPEFGQIWANFGQIWANAAVCGDVWAKLGNFGQIWANLGKFRQIWRPGLALGPGGDQRAGGRTRHAMYVSRPATPEIALALPTHPTIPKP